MGYYFAQETKATIAQALRNIYNSSCGFYFLVCPSRRFISKMPALLPGVDCCARDAKGSVLLFASFGEQKTAAKRSPTQPAWRPKKKLNVKIQVNKIPSFKSILTTLRLQQKFNIESINKTLFISIPALFKLKC